MPYFRYLYQPAVRLTHVRDSQADEILNQWCPAYGGETMGSAIGLRDDFDGSALRRLARASKSANQARRLLALAEIYDGGSRTVAARIGGVGLQIVRDWVMRFNAGGLDGLLDGKAPGPRSRLNDAQRQALVEVVERGPIPAIHGVVRWRLIDLVQWLHEEFAVSLDETTVGREFEKLRKGNAASISAFSAWEDEALQTQLAKLLEPSLTLRQIREILDFLEEEVDKAPGAVCVILDAIAGSITREEVIDTLQLRLYHVMVDNGRIKKLDERYSWRSWRILSRSLSWATDKEIKGFPALLEKGWHPFDILRVRSSGDGLLKLRDGIAATLAPVEHLRAVCAVWGKADEWREPNNMPSAVTMGFFKSLTKDVKSLLRDLRGEKPLGDEVCGSKMNNQHPGAGWMVWSCLRCVLVEYPKALE